MCPSRACIKQMILWLTSYVLIVISTLVVVHYSVDYRGFPSGSFVVPSNVSAPIGPETSLVPEASPPTPKHKSTKSAPPVIVPAPSKRQQTKRAPPTSPTPPRQPEPAATVFLCAAYCHSETTKPGYDYSSCSCSAPSSDSTGDGAQHELSLQHALGRLDELFESVLPLLSAGKVDYSISAILNRLTRSRHSLASYVMDVLVSFVTLSLGQSFGFGASILFFAYDATRMQGLVALIMSVIARIAIVYLTHSVKGPGSVVFALVFFPVTLLGAAMSEGVMLFLLIATALTSFFFLALCCSTNRIPLDMTALLAVISVRYFGVLHAIINTAFTFDHTWSNVVLVIARALLLGSGTATPFASFASYADAVSIVHVLPRSFLSEFTTEDEIMNLAWVLTGALFIVRILVILTFRYAMCQMRFTTKYRDAKLQTPAVLVQYTTALFAYAPLSRGDCSRSTSLMVCNATIAVSMLSGNIDLFFVAIVLYVLSIAVLGELVYELPKLDKPDVPTKVKAKTQVSNRSRSNDGKNGGAVVVKEMHSVPVSNSDPAPVPKPVSATVVDEDKTVLHHSDPFALPAPSIDIASAVIRTVNRCTIAFKSAIGRATGVFIAPRVMVTVRHAFHRTPFSSESSSTLSDYAIVVNGEPHIPSEVCLGPLAQDGEAVIKLTFPTDVISSDHYPTLERHDYEKPHMMIRRGGVSVCSTTRPRPFDPTGVCYDHACLPADSGSGGYQLDGSAHQPLLTTLHEGVSTRAHVGVLVPDENDFVPIAQRSDEVGVDTPFLPSHLERVKQLILGNVVSRGRSPVDTSTTRRRRKAENSPAKKDSGPPSVPTPPSPLNTVDGALYVPLDPGSHDCLPKKRAKRGVMTMCRNFVNTVCSLPFANGLDVKFFVS